MNRLKLSQLSKFNLDILMDGFAERTIVAMKTQNLEYKQIEEAWVNTVGEILGDLQMMTAARLERN